MIKIHPNDKSIGLSFYGVCKRTENMPYISNEVLDVVKEILYKDYYESVEEK